MQQSSPRIHDRSAADVDDRRAWPDLREELCTHQISGGVGLRQGYHDGVDMARRVPELFALNELGDARHGPAVPAESKDPYAGRVYLSFSPQNQGQREQALTAFVPASVAAANPDLGWNGTGQLNLQAEQVAGITVQDPRHAVVTLLVLVNGQLMQLGVPVAASGRGVVVSGEPAWLSAPTAPRGSDSVARSRLMNELPAFFQAYAANSDSAALNRFEVRGVSLTGLGGATTQITVTVIWQLPDQSGSAAGNLGMTSKLEMTYSMSVVGLHSGKWYVKEIGASTEAVGAR